MRNNNEKQNKQANKNKKAKYKKNKQTKKQIYLYASKTFHIYIKYIFDLPWAMNISFYLIVLLIAMLLIEANTFFLNFFNLSSIHTFSILKNNLKKVVLGKCN